MVCLSPGALPQGTRMAVNIINHTVMFNKHYFRSYIYILPKKALYADEDIDMVVYMDGSIHITTIIQIAFCGDYYCRFALLVLDILILISINQNYDRG